MSALWVAAVALAGVNLLPVGAPAPRLVERPNLAAYAEAYPHGAALAGLDGQAVLRCKVGRGGRLDACAVAGERPLGAGFGRAALNLARMYRLDAKDGPAEGAAIDVPVDFATSADENRLQVAAPWLAAPSFAQVGAIYPDIGGGVTGEVALHCGLGRDGGVSDCKPIYQQPSDRDFGDAALKLAPLFRTRIPPALLRAGQPLAVNILLRIAAPYGDEFKSRRLADPEWLVGPPALDALYPAAAKGVDSGVGYVDCMVAPDGTLKDCTPAPGETPDLGFSAAAVKAVAAMRMSPWTRAGGPVDGASVRLAVRFTKPAK